MAIFQNLEYYMRGSSFRWIVNILLTLIIFLNAQFGHYLGIETLALSISVIWPATGFSLAAVLLLGFHAWPGILLGNFLSNFWDISSSGQEYASAFFVGGATAAGSLFQALLGGYIIRRFSSPEYFRGVRDIFIFLLPASLMTCMVASTMGITALYLNGTLPPQNIFYTWLTFWLGDSFGIYIFTPLLIVWLTQKPEVPLSHYKTEAFLMAFIFVFLTVLTSYWFYPLTHLNIPLALWATFRFRMHGATLSILLISIPNVIATTLGYSPFTLLFAENSLLILVSFLAIIVFVSLILAAVISERDSAWKLLQSHNLDLREAVDLQMEELKEMHSEIFIKEKLASLGMLTLGIARQIQPPLQEINNNIKGCVDSLGNMQKSLTFELKALQPHLTNMFQENFSQMSKALENISKLEKQLHRVVQIIQEQSKRTAPGRIEVKPINLNTLLNICLNQALEDCSVDYPGFHITVSKNFDRAVKRITGLPEELAYAFIYLMGNAIYSLKTKSDATGGDFNPELEVGTEDFPKNIRITIRDNGTGVPPEEAESYFHSFFNADPLEDTNGLGLQIAHDIIVHVHHGEITVDSQEGEYLKISLTLPKTPL